MTRREALLAAVFVPVASKVTRAPAVTRGIVVTAGPSVAWTATTYGLVVSFGSVGHGAPVTWAK